MRNAEWKGAWLDAAYHLDVHCGGVDAGAGRSSVLPGSEGRGDGPAQRSEGPAQGRAQVSGGHLPGLVPGRVAERTARQDRHVASSGAHDVQRLEKIRSQAVL